MMFHLAYIDKDVFSFVFKISIQQIHNLEALHSFESFSQGVSQECGLEMMNWISVEPEKGVQFTGNILLYP